MAGRGKAVQAFGLVSAIGKLIYHSVKANNLGRAQATYKCLSDDPDVPHTYAEIFYNPEMGFPFESTRESGALNIKIGSFTVEEDGSHKPAGTEYDRAHLNLTPKTSMGVTSGSVNLFRSVGSFIEMETGCYVSDKKGHTPTAEEFRKHAGYVLDVVKDTAAGNFRNLREDRFKSWDNPNARQMPDGLKPIIAIQQAQEKWSGNPVGKGPSEM